MTDKNVVAKCFHKFSNPCDVWLRLYKAVQNDTDKMQLIKHYIILVILLFSVFLTCIDTFIPEIYHYQFPFYVLRPNDAYMCQ